MNQFALARPTSFEEANEFLSNGRYSLPVLKAGGMDLVDHLKEGLEEPDLLIDVKPLRSDAFDGEMIRTERDGSGEPGFVIEAMTTLAQLGKSEAVRRQAPAIAQAASSAATPHVRNVASVAGNLLQRPRCWYYRNEQFPCLKKGGHMCYAVEGENKFHAIFGEGPCHIVHPSNIAVPLYVLDGRVHLTGGRRDSLLIANLFHMPDADVESEHNLAEGEVVTHISFNAAPKSAFYAVKEKQSFDWPLVMCAVALEMQGNTIQRARVCAGAVAPVPWPLRNVEEALAGVDPRDEEALRRACAGAVEGARPMTQNAYKTRLLPVAVRRAVRKAAGLPVEEVTA